ncbi:MAG: HD domain-containing protein, partial [Ilumatobacteraceae bacterium]
RVRNTPVTHLDQVTTSKPRWIPGVLTIAALHVVVDKFAHIARKCGDTPYLSHLLAVSALVMEHGGSEEQAAAALLHDVIEDCDVSPGELVDLLVTRGVEPGAATRVTQMVQATTDGTPEDKRIPADWKRRKQNYIDALEGKPSDDPALLVSLADKVHNAEATAALVRGGTSAREMFDNSQFNAKAPDQQWYYTRLAEVFTTKLGHVDAARPLVHRLTAAVEDIFRDPDGAGSPRTREAFG